MINVNLNMYTSPVVIVAVYFQIFTALHTDVFISQY